MLPTPTSLSSHILPPSSSTIRRDNVRPRPVPLLPRGSASALLERLEDPLAVWGTPIPVSVTVMVTSVSDRVTRITTDRRPR